MSRSDRHENDVLGNAGDEHDGGAHRARERVQGVPGGLAGLALELPVALVEAIAEQAAAIVLAQVSSNGRDGWPAWMSVKTAAAYLDVTEERVRKLVAAREIPFAQEDRNCRVFLERSALDAWMASMQRVERPR